MELSRLVKEHPEDMTAWLELVDLQDSLFAKENGGQASTPDEVRGLADIKASLLESALRHAKLETDMERLLVRLMREGSKAWNPARLAKRWQDVAQKHRAGAVAHHSSRHSCAVARLGPSNGADRRGLDAGRSIGPGDRHPRHGGSGQRQIARPHHGGGRRRRGHGAHGRAGRRQRSEFIGAAAVRKVIVVPGKLVNVVA